MNKIFNLFNASAVLMSVLLLALGSPMWAQSANKVSPVISSAPEKQTQAELLESYRQLSEQLHAAQITMVTNRLEAEAAASARDAAINEKLDTLKLAVAAERERLQMEARLAATERDRQQIAAQEMNGTILRIVIFFGSIGLLALFTITLLQWRGNKGMAEFATQLQPLPAPAQAGWLPAADNTAADEHMAASTQRLQSTIGRMERRIRELEQTVVPPAATAADEKKTPEDNSPDPLNNATPSAHIAELLARGRPLLGEKKLAAALACYDEILSVDANHPEALVKKGSVLEKLQQDQDALDCYDRAIAADPNMALAYLSKGGLCVRLERFEEALECYEGALHAGNADNRSGIARRIHVAADWTAKR